MFEDEINDWRRILTCPAMLEKLTRDIDRLLKARTRLLDKPDDTSVSNPDAMHADDDVREIVASIAKHVSELDAELDPSRALPPLDPKHTTVAAEIRGYHRRTYECPSKSVWFSMVPGLRKTIRQLVIDVQPGRPLSDLWLKTYQESVTFGRDLVMKSLSELEKIPAVEALAYAEAMLRHEHNSAPAVAAADGEPVAESLVNLPPGVETANSKAAAESLADKEMPPSDETSNGVVSSTLAQPAAAQISPVGSWNEVSNPVTADAEDEASSTGALDVNVEPSSDEAKPQSDASSTGTLDMKVEPSGDGARPRQKCYDRDQQFLRWKREGLGEAAIRDRWNELSEINRKEISSDCYKRLSDGDKKKGRAVVVEALKKISEEEKKSRKRKNS